MEACLHKAGANGVLRASRLRQQDHTVNRELMVLYFNEYLTRMVTLVHDVTTLYSVMKLFSHSVCGSEDQELNTSLS